VDLLDDDTSMDLLLLNLYLLGQLDAERHDLSCLVEYVEKVSDFTGVPIHPSYPLSGRDAFRTATGVHAAAIIKAEGLGDLALADRVYSAVPARVFGRRQTIEVGHYSGRSNVIHWLVEHGHAPDETLVDQVLAAAKATDHTLTDLELSAIVDSATTAP
jgi:2-isopropylmalate synthase